MGTTKGPTELQSVPYDQKLSYAQNAPGPYDPSQDPYNYTGFTTYDNQQPITGYDWWAPGNPTVTQNFGNDMGSVTTNPVTTPRPVNPTMNNAYISSFYQRTPSLGYSAPSQATPNASTTGVQNSPALDAYINMMGGGNNYGAVIGQQQQNTPTPNTPTPTTPTAHPGTRYGVWSGDDSGTPYYVPMLPWGLTAQTMDGQNSINFNGSPTGLQWDYSTGHLVGGDQLADAYRSQWEALFPGRGFEAQQGSSRRNLTVPQNVQTPFWWESAMDPNFTHSAYRSWSPESGSVWNFAQQPPDWLDTGFARSYMVNGQYPAYNPAEFGGGLPSGTPLAPGGGIPSGGGGGQGGGLSGGGPVYGGGGYGGGNPWGGLNGIEDAMTSASAFGRRRRRG